MSEGRSSAEEVTAFVVGTAGTPDGYSRCPEYAADTS
jgi:uncharacterized Fe-S cluster-containing protein